MVLLTTCLTRGFAKAAAHGTSTVGRLHRGTRTIYSWRLHDGTHTIGQLQRHTKDRQLHYVNTGAAALEGSRTF